MSVPRLMLAVPEDDLSINLFADSGRVSAKPVPYRQAASGTDLDWDFIYIRGPFVQSDFDDPSIKESIEKLLQAAKTNTYSVDNITNFSDLLQEDKWRQYELFADIMPQTKLIRSFKSHKISNWLIKKRISGRSRDIHFDVSDLSNDAEPKNYIVQKRLDIKTEYRAFMVRDKLILPLEIKSSKTETTRNKAIGLKKDAPQEVLEICRLVYEKLKFDLVGLDIAETHDGYYLLEVNRSPQFVNYLRLSSINLAEILYDYLLNAVDK